MYTIKLNKKTKNMTLKKIERSVKLVQKKSTIKLTQTGRRGPQGLQGVQGPQGEQGEPGPAGADKNYVMEFTNSDTVTVNHNLSKYPAVTVSDSTGEEVEGEVDYISINQLVVYFTASFSGKVICN